jgi:hypothetical protein
LPKTRSLGQLSLDLVGFSGLKSFANILPKAPESIEKDQ